MTHKYRVMICDDSATERHRFYARHFDHFEIVGVEQHGDRFIETDPMDSVSKLYTRIHQMRRAGALPDLLILDLFYKRALPDVDQRERDFVDDIVVVKAQFRQLRDKVMEYLEPTGVALLQRLRETDHISAQELPVAVYTDKDFNLLPPDHFNLLYRLDAETLHKDRDEATEWQITPAAEYLRLLHVVQRSQTVPRWERRVFISHGTDPCWNEVQHFLETKLARPTIELAQSSSHGKTVIDKLTNAATLCSHAIVLMTGDDAAAEGAARVRENVMHEIGYFQGRLGLDRVILVREEGVSMPSNLGGIVYLQFTKGNVTTVFEALAAELKVDLQFTTSS
ncbi:MAG: nucleotide-binding protein [Methylobacter sp.]|jgi:predicted nucleotide-binding protein|nr:nucleotide-binding protein [Methylobacter sp.]